MTQRKSSCSESCGQLLHFGDAQTNAGRALRRRFPICRRRRECRSPSSILQFRSQRFLLRVAEEFHDRRFPFAVFHLDEGESFRAERFRDLGQFVDLADGEARRNPFALIAFTTPPASSAPRNILKLLDAENHLPDPSDPCRNGDPACRCRMRPIASR